MAVPRAKKFRLAREGGAHRLGRALRLDRCRCTAIRLGRRRAARRQRVDLSLEFTRQLLELPFDPENLKLLGHQKDAALTIISQQIRIEAERLRAPPARGGSVKEFYRRYDGGSSEEGEP